MPYGGIFDFEEKALKLDQVNTWLEDPNIWNNQKHAQELGREKKALEHVVLALLRLKTALVDASELFSLAREENDTETLEAVEKDISSVKKEIENLEFARMFSNPLDRNNCYFDIQAGAGGTEAQDCASMILRQYLRYCDHKEFKAEILEISDGEIAGIKTATVKVEGEYAYGYLRTEAGVHRLVRKSPFDANHGRHTSFCSLYVYPEIDDAIDIDINPADVRVDTYRASGAGGQHVNKTDSAVRLTHIPSGIVVQCQNDRSQHKNRAEAWSMLRSRLYEMELRKQRAEQQKLEESKPDISWGNQIRSYVLDQSRIKDLRTNLETGNTKAVLDGDLDDFIAESLKQGV